MAPPIAETPGTPGPRTPVSRPAPLACSECRKKHLKCDAAQPRCSRCTTQGLECTYTLSRRGRCGRTTRKPNITTQQPLLNQSLPLPQTTALPIAPRESLDREPATTSSIRSFQTPEASPHSAIAGLNNNDTIALQAPRPAPTAQQNGYPDREGHVDLFYNIFHPNHPILVPRSCFTKHAYPTYLQQVVQFIGSHYGSTGTNDSLRNSITIALSESTDKSPHMVQALILMAIILHARFEATEAASHLAKAVQVAIETGMNRGDYATLHGGQNPVNEESLRRTWWELYVTDGYFAALHQQSSFKCDTVTSEPFLPCEESAYTGSLCNVNLRRLQDFNNRWFTSDSYPYSSFCFRIEAIGILSRVLALAGEGNVLPSRLQAVDNAIAAWKHHLPSNKTTSLQSYMYGEADPLMLQAHVFIYCASIILHFPRSQMPLTLPSSTGIDCVKHATQSASPLVPHAMKAIRASEQMASLAALPMSIEQQSPYLICGLVLACVVQLSAYSMHEGGNTAQCGQEARDHIVLITGALSTLGRTWNVARQVLTQINRIASALFQPELNQVSPETCAPSLDSGIDICDEMMDLSWLDVFYNNVSQHQMGSDEIFTGI